MLLLLAAFGAVALAGGLGCLLLCWLVPDARRLRWPPRRFRFVNWNGLDIVAIFLLWQLVPVLLGDILLNLKAFDLLYPDHLAEFTIRRAVFAYVVAAPLQFFAMVGFLVYLRDAPLYQLGILRKGWAPTLVIAYLAWLMMTPPVEGLHWLLTLITETRPHALERVFALDLRPWERLLAYTAPVLVAAVLEELFFRGILLPWQVAASLSEQGAVAVAAVAAAVVFGMDKDGVLLPPLIFIVCMLPGYVVLPWVHDQWWWLGLRRRLGWEIEPPIRESSEAVKAAVDGIAAGSPDYKPELELVKGPVELQYAPAFLVDLLRPALNPSNGPILAIWGNSLLFAALHASAWPAPVALLLLGCGLAWLRLRTQSLFAPIAVHALFNAVGVVGTILENAK